MKVRKLKKFVIPSIIGVTLVSVLTLALVYNSLKTETVFKSDNDYRYTTKSFFRNYMPTSGEDVTIAMPYTSEEVSIYKDYYDKDSDEEARKKSIIYYENVYMQNSGIDYMSNNTFDIISILDGNVIKVSEDEMMGKYVEIRHSNDLISVYQSLGDINVEENQNVKRGDVIATSGKNKLYSEINNGLHFELSYKGSYVNPNLYLMKKVQDM